MYKKLAENAEEMATANLARLRRAQVKAPAPAPANLQARNGPLRTHHNPNFTEAVSQLPVVRSEHVRTFFKHEHEQELVIAESPDIILFTILGIFQVEAETEDKSEFSDSEIIFTD